jgi:hypothetical protein
MKRNPKVKENSPKLLSLYSFYYCTWVFVWDKINAIGQVANERGMRGMVVGVRSVDSMHMQGAGHSLCIGRKIEEASGEFFSGFFLPIIPGCQFAQSTSP